MYRTLAILSIVLGFCQPAIAQHNPKPVGLWVQEFKKEALEAGISERIVDMAMKDFVPSERIISLDRHQPESTRTFTQYMESVVPNSRVKEGRRLLAANRPLLSEVSAHYGVPMEVIVALWGIETSYGKVTGSFNVPHALATLAYDGRRAEFFRKELLNALKILDQGHIVPAAMEGSWAGAMGQSQFMPSSFLSYAVDYNKDGRRDIWSSKPDIFASIANYLKQSGWNAGEGIFTKVRLPQKFDPAHENIDRFRPLKDWKALGITYPDGQTLPASHMQAALVFPGKPYEGAYLVYKNYHVILKWNRSRYFATAVGTLTEKLADGR